MKRKGATVILSITVFSIFVPVAMFAQTFNASNILQNSVEYRSGDVGVLARSQIQKQNLQDQYQRGLKYSLNEEAFDRGASNTWRSIPDLSGIQTSFVSGVQTELNNRFTSQDIGCEVGTIPVLAEDAEAGDYVIQTSGKVVTCSRSHSSVNNYFTSDIAVEHPENRFLKLADYAIRASENFKEEMPDSIEGSGSATGSCGEPYSDVADEARNNAEDNALSGLSYGSSALSATEDVEGVSAEQSTSYDGSATATDTTPEDNRCCEERGQVVDGQGNRNCEEWDDFHEAEATYSASTARFDLTVTDTENELVYSGGEENLDYNVEYVYSFN